MVIVVTAVVSTPFVVLMAFVVVTHMFGVGTMLAVHLVPGWAVVLMACLFVIHEL
jgi:hypothetical protein